MSLDDDVDLFVALRSQLLRRLDAKEGELRDGLAKAKDAKREVAGRGRRGSAQAPGGGTQGDRILAWLRLHPGPHGVAELAEGARIDAPSARQALLALHGARLIERPARGVYQAPGPRLLPPHVDPAPERSREGPPRRETPTDRMRRMSEAQGKR